MSIFILPSSPGLSRRLKYSEYVSHCNKKKTDKPILIDMKNDYDFALIENFLDFGDTHTRLDNFDYDLLLDNYPIITHGLSISEVIDKTNTFFFDSEAFCSICQEKSVVLLRQLNCQHSFHISCIDMWLENNKTCPLCKT